jgi:hypothetical protein
MFHQHFLNLNLKSAFAVLHTYNRDLFLYLLKSTNLMFVCRHGQLLDVELV